MKGRKYEERGGGPGEVRERIRGRSSAVLFHGMEVRYRERTRKNVTRETSFS